MNPIDAAKLTLVILAPTLIGAVIVFAPKWCAALGRMLPDRTSGEPETAGPPIEQLAVDLRRLLRLHRELSISAQVSMRAHRLWAVEAAIGVRALEAAKALGVPCRDPEMPGALHRGELEPLLRALAGAGLVLPEKVGPFVGNGRY